MHFRNDCFTIKAISIAKTEGRDEEIRRQSQKPLVYCTIGKEDEDLEKVCGALNELLFAEYGILVDYRKFDWNIYGDQIADYLNLNEKLDDFLEGEGKALYEAIPQIWWEGAKINGHIYGVPTSKELAAVSQWMYPRELVEKYGIDITAVKTLEDLEPILAVIKRNEPEYIALELNQYAHFFEVYGYEYILDYQIPLMLKSEDPDKKLVNILETELGEQVLNTLRKYYLAGYINQDAPIRESQTLQEGEKVFVRQAQGGPYASLEWSKQRGYEVVAQVMSPVVVNTESLRGAYMCIPSSSDRPDKGYLRRDSLYAGQLFPVGQKGRSAGGFMGEVPEI